MSAVTMDGMLFQIEKMLLDAQFYHLEENLKNQFRKYKEVIEVRPNLRRRKKEENFKVAYANTLGDQNLHTLYDSIMGKPTLFSKPILEVYLKHSQGDRLTMESLCQHLTNLFFIGLTALEGYTAFMRDDEEKMKSEWSDRLDEVLEKMDEALLRCH